jgi:hypothetical protein
MADYTAKAQESVINVNVLCSCLQHTFHGMAAVCKWPMAIHADIFIEFSFCSSLQFVCVCDLMMSLAIYMKWLDWMQLFVYKILQGLLLGEGGTTTL